MPKFEYNPNNTEGHYPTSIDFIDTEIKKGNKIVATDLVDLYDTYPETQTPDQGDALKYDGNSGIWIPDVGAGGSSCNPFSGYTYLTKEYINFNENPYEEDTFGYATLLRSTIVNNKWYVFCNQALAYTDLNNNSINWVLLNDGVVPERIMHSTLNYNNKIYVFGGQYSENNIYKNRKDFWEYDIQTNTWVELTNSNGPLERDRFGAIIVDNKMYIISGSVGNNAMYSDCYYYDFIDQTWNRIANVPYPIHSIQPIFYDGYIYIYGGSVNQDNFIRYDIDNDTWEIMPEHYGKQRFNYSSTMIGNKMYTYYRGQLSYFDFETMQWYDVYYKSNVYSDFLTTIYHKNVFYFMCSKIYNSPSFSYTIPYENTIFIDQDTTTPEEGTLSNPFKSLNNCFSFLEYCKTVPFGIILTIQLLSNINIYDNTVLNYIQGDKLEINGNDNTINLYYTELDQLNNEYIPLHLYNNHSIKEIYNVNINHSLIYTTEQYTTDTNGKVDSINGTPVSQLITTEYNEDIYALKINNHSVVKMNNIHNTSINDEIIINKISSSGENDRYDIIYIHKHNIFLDNRSILISDNLTLDKIKVDNSTIIVEKNEYLFDITLWNNSTFILNNAVVHPNVDIYESVYIIEGVEQ